VLLSDIVATSGGVARSSGRRAKIEQIAELLVRVPVDEVPIAVAFLSGDLTQRQIGVGYAALMGLGSAPAAADSGAAPASTALAEAVAAEEAHTAPASQASLTLTETDRAFGEIGALTGPGSQVGAASCLAASSAGRPRTNATSCSGWWRETCGRAPWKGS
jgi:DNA ligase 1